MVGGMSCSDTFIQRSKSHWILGPDGHGDLLCPGTVASLVKWADSIGGVDLVTADGGMDIHGQWKDQESINFPLVFAEYLTGIQCLQPGKDLVVKNYTLRTDPGRQLVYHMSRTFRQLVLCKPVASKAANNELYMVGIGLRARPDPSECTYFMGLLGRPASTMGSWACPVATPRPFPGPSSFSMAGAAEVNAAVHRVLRPHLDRLTVAQCRRICLYMHHHATCRAGGKPCRADPLPAHVARYLRFLRELSSR
jgi:hypothetical protein